MKTPVKNTSKPIKNTTKNQVKNTSKPIKKTIKKISKL